MPHRTDTFKRAMLPATWLFGAAVVWVAGGPKTKTTAPNPATSDTYYVVAHVHYVISLALAFVVIAFIYFLLDTIFGIRYRRFLGWGQFGLMAAGTFLILAPSLFLGSIELPVRQSDPGREFAVWNSISAAGYGLTLLSALLLLILLGDAAVRRFAQ